MPESASVYRKQNGQWVRVATRPYRTGAMRPNQRVRETPTGNGTSLQNQLRMAPANFGGAQSARNRRRR